MKVKSKSKRLLRNKRNAEEKNMNKLTVAERTKLLLRRARPRTDKLFFQQSGRKDQEILDLAMECQVNADRVKSELINSDFGSKIDSAEREDDVDAFQDAFCGGIRTALFDVRGVKNRVMATDHASLTEMMIII